MIGPESRGYKSNIGELDFSFGRSNSTRIRSSPSKPANGSLILPLNPLSHKHQRIWFVVSTCSHTFLGWITGYQKHFKLFCNRVVESNSFPPCGFASAVATHPQGSNGWENENVESGNCCHTDEYASRILQRRCGTRKSRSSCWLRCLRFREDEHPGQWLAPSC